MNESRPRPKISEGHLTLSGDRIFYTIQGEGASIGMPAVFIRLHLCNLSCSWCDTPYTWNEKSDAFWDEWKQFTIEKIAVEVSKFPCRRLVITGGEPLLQQAAISKLVAILCDWQIEIETNGTVIPSEDLAACCQFNVSPKLSNSGISLEKRIRAQCIQEFNKIPKAYFKFVVASSEDLKEVKELATNFSIAPERIIVMPEGTSSEKITLGLQQLAQDCRDLNYRLLPRLHVQIWGNKRAI